jgi:hypothetical protein
VSVKLGQKKIVLPRGLTPSTARPMRGHRYLRTRTKLRRSFTARDNRSIDIFDCRREVLSLKHSYLKNLSVLKKN